MPPKKRKISDGVDESSSSTLLGRKRKRTELDDAEIMQELYETIRGHKTEDGRLLCEDFIRAPKRRNDPDYHNVVTTPIDLLKVQHKLKNDEYKTLDAFTEDIDLLVNNSKAYYKEGAQEYQDACELWELFTESKTVLLGEELTNLNADDSADDDDDEEEEEEEEEDAEDDDDDDEDDEDVDDTFDEESKDGMEVRKINPPDVVQENSSSIVIPGTGGNPTIKLKMTSSKSAEEKAEVCSVKPMDEDSCSQQAGFDDGASSCKMEMDGEGSQDTVTTPKGVPEIGRNLRERRYTYRDFLFPKVVISEKQQEDMDKDQKDADDRDDRSSVSGSLAGDDDDTAYEELFASVVMAMDGERCISSMFKVLPSRKKYPDYFEIIEDPIDLKTIAQKIQNNEYKNVDSMVRDLNLMVVNAKSFNEPGSQIYRDAVTLKKIIMTKKHELDQRSTQQRPVRSERIRTRKANAGQRLSQVIAALESDSDKEEVVKEPPPAPVEMEEESEEDSSMIESDEDPLWLLFRAVKNQRNSLGQRISEPFLKLPSKRIYPDYYEEIKKPMSILKIQKKLKNGQYGEDLDMLARDIDLVFTNAKRYNIDESKLYKDAVKLQGIMKAKLKEIKRCSRYKCTTTPKVNSIVDPLSYPIMPMTSSPKLEIASPPISLDMYLQEEIFGQGSEITIKKGRRSNDASSTTSEESGRRKPGRKSMSPEEAFKHRLWTLYKAIYDYRFDSRRLIDIFITLPSKKDYPDYYQVISEPIDMTMIETKIKSDKYLNEKALISDFELMFNNARHYNEENSQVYRDAQTLERILMTKVRSMPAIDGIIKTPGRNKCRSSKSTLPAKLQELYNTIRDFTDSKKRILSTPFMKLPLKSDYPDYYEVIKRPMDMQKVSQRMVNNQYSSVEEMVSDIVLMFDNACKYNEPDSLIYKDALTLQRVCLEKKTELCADDNVNTVPDVKAQVQELMTNLFISTFNHADEEGRSYSDAFMELPPKISTEDGENGESKEKPSPTFDQVKRNLDRGRYRRLDRFQEDMFEVFEFARRVSRTDSQVYEDSIELQMFFIRMRDELCRNGEYLLTPALSYRETHLHKDLEIERENKAPKEQRDDEKKKEQEEEVSLQEEQAGKTDTVDFNEQTYVAGDFVYIEPRDKGLDPHIVCIEKMWKEDGGEQMLYGCWFLRPNETYHLATRKFLEKEVFKSDFYDTVPFSKVLSKCHVVSVRDYFKMRPEGFDDKDVYVCESRYSGRVKTFKKIKVWQLPRNENVKLILREQPLSQVRVVSVFAEKSNSEERGHDDGLMDVLDKDREVVILDTVPGAEEGCTYYEQYQTHTTWIKLGDHIYIKGENDEGKRILNVEQIWLDPNGDTLVHGALYRHPEEVEHPPTRLFYKREVFKSTVDISTHVANILGRCAVLTYKEYTTSRPTEIAESDIFVCDSKYLEAEHQIKKFLKVMKKPALSYKVCDDEILFFRKPMIPNKEPSPLLLKAAEETFLPDLDTNTMDSSYSETMSYQGDMSLHEAATPEPATEKKRKNKSKVRNVSGYIIFAAEHRKEVSGSSPDMSFGEISRLVGAKWKALEKETKEKYEEKAKISMAEAASRQAEADRALNESIGNYWPNMGQQYSPSAGYPGHMPPHTMMGPQAANANRQSQMYSQNGVPIPHGMHPQLHMGQFNPQNGTPLGMYHNASISNPGGPSMAPPPPPKPTSPMFVSVPPKTQRLVHSEAYLRYIENLTPESRTVGNWDRSLYATPDNTQLQPNSKLPVQWLANGVGHHDNTVSALWALRDLMMKDAMTVSRTLEFSQL